MTGDKGFTLVEILIVVSIIGILATIAIPAYLNQRAKGYNAAALADAKNVKTSLEAFYAEVHRYP